MFIHHLRIHALPHVACRYSEARCGMYAQNAPSFPHIPNTLLPRLPNPRFPHLLKHPFTLRLATLTLLPTVKSSLTIFPPFDSQEEQTTHKAHDSPLEFTFDDPFEFESIDIKTEMAGASSPYIKAEPTDFNSFNPNHFQQHNGFMSHQNNNFNQVHNSNNHNNVDPNSIMNGGNFNQNFTSQNMSSSFMMGNSGIADDELMDTLSMNFDGSNGQNSNSNNHNNNHNFQQQQQQQDSFNPQYMTPAGSVPMSMTQPQHQHINNNMYSSTPEGAPIQSPFISNFNYGQFRPVENSQQQPFSLPTSSAGFRNGMTAAQQHMNAMERKISESRSPATPNTPGLGALHLGEPEYPVPGMQHQQQQPRAVMGAHNRSSSLNNWEGISNPHSWTDVSPFGSPATGQPMAPQHPQISEVLKSTSHGGGKVAASLPTKMEHGTPAYQTQEAKRRRRRESHNLVERRRRDNINERIHELAGLVPQHRLEDEKVRKHLQTNSPLSPSITATGISPPQATSLLAGGTGRRATGGNVTTGLPLDDKDKGPNKGDILNGSVAWTRDLLWIMQMKLDQEAKLKEVFRAQGQEWPFPQSEEEKRMQSELREVIEKNVLADNLTPYSRGPGTGLRVPGFTAVNGDPIASEQGNGHQQSLSPGYQSGGSGISSGRDQYAWQPEQADLKEEDEFGFEM